ncbi:uncharacterized protein LOC110390262 [Numida meleagris]|uniref:uncharacterized protein LOC110390262 n=1 Tax=Numida meleagris TaxID=8996 RepID=UPI000B3E14A6|nr:uncharacterized protein LOC110390262 [Numida meleagris]
MDSVIKVLLQFCKDYCGKNMPSKKEITAVLSRLEREGEIDTPEDVLNHQKWDSLTSALARHTMSVQKAAELKTWGLILGAVQAAREEGKAANEVRKLLGLDEGAQSTSGEPDDPGGGKTEGRSGGGDFVIRCSAEEQDTAPTKIAPSAPRANPLPNKEQDEGPWHLGWDETTPPYPSWQLDQLTYPSLKRVVVNPAGIKTCSASLQLVQASRNGSTAFWCVNHSSQLCIINKLAEDALCPFIQVTDEGVKQVQMQY